MPNNPPFELDNRSKRSIVLDVATPEGNATALELIASADVFLTNIRVEALKRIGLDPDTLMATDDRLVYGLVTGFGLDGPDADRAALRHRRLLGPFRHRQPAHARPAAIRRSSAAAWATIRRA